MTAEPVRLCRVQAADGRGPWRPGLSKYWIDEDSDQPLQPDLITAFGLDWKKKIPSGWHAGCACRSFDGLFAWFTPTERRRLEGIGYQPISFMADIIIAENKDQVVFARRLPLHREIILHPWRKTA